MVHKHYDISVNTKKIKNKKKYINDFSEGSFAVHEC